MTSSTNTSLNRPGFRGDHGLPRVRRERMPREGKLLLVNGSRHDWLEGRGPWLTLIDMSSWSGPLEDGVAADPSPAKPALAVDRDPFECRAAVGPAEAPGHLEDAGRVLDVPHAKRRRKPDSRVRGDAIARSIEGWEDLPEQPPLALREPAPVALERVRDLELHRSGGSASRTESSSPTPSTAVTRPAATSASASRSIVCHRSVQNQA